uniref:Uncharacterized protein n=1 Tax=Arundo donax TaxID=35708 RepID=A0A0A9F2C6_ARUDO
MPMVAETNQPSPRDSDLPAPTPANCNAAACLHCLPPICCCSFCIGTDRCWLFVTPPAIHAFQQLMLRFSSEFCACWSRSCCLISTGCAAGTALLGSSSNPGGCR